MAAPRLRPTRPLALALVLAGSALGASAQLPTTQKLLASDGETDDWFGGSVDLQGDWAVVGARADDDLGDRTGAVYVFQRQAGTWAEVQKLVPSDGGPLWHFGGSVSIDQGRIAVGAIGGLTAGTYTGAVYVYELVAGSWVLEQRIDASDGAEGDQFGASVDLDGDLLAVGATSEDDGGNASGAVYLLRSHGAGWIEEAKLPGGGPVDEFGWSVCVDGDQLAVGARRAPAGAIRPGRAYVYTYDGATWTLEAELSAPAEQDDDLFGHSIALRGDRCAVGAIWDDELGNNAGVVEAFQRTGSGWSHEQSVLPLGLDGMDYAGSALALRDGRLVVGADGVGLTNARGAAYVYEHSGTHWANQIPMVPADPSSRGRMGNSVAIDAGTVLVGSFYARDGTGALTGAAYVFEPPADPGLVYCTCEPGGCSGTDATAGCPNSTGAGALLEATGFTLPDTIDFVVSGARPNQFGLVFQANSRTLSPFGGGYRCANIQIVRLTPPRAVQPDGSLTVGPGAGDPPVSTLGGVTPGEGVTRRYQFWYRDPGGGCGNFNLSNGYELVW